MALASAAIDLLFTRLRWPVPRVRLEACRSIARLIRAGDQATASALLSWLRTRSFESEAIIGLGIIDAFDLSSHFAYDDVRNAVQAPSYLSDALLAENFGRSEGLWPFRYAYAPAARADLKERLRAQFSAMNGIPRHFHSAFSMLERDSGAPFLRRWQHEWEWLQAEQFRSRGDPQYFFAGDRDSTGQFDFADRETYVSAYLRTLSFAVSEWGLSPEVAVYFARSAVTLNRGLADVMPTERPLWTDGILVGDRNPREAAQEIWNSAQPDGGQLVAALRAAELGETGFVQFEFDLASHSNDRSLSGAPKEQRGSLLRNTGYAGSVPPDEKQRDGKRPTHVCGMVMPIDVGRLLVDVVTKVRLPSPNFFDRSLDLRCTPDSVLFDMDDQEVARWQHWYSDWQPTTPNRMDSLLGYRTVIGKDLFLQTCMAKDLAHGVWCKMTWGTRQYAYSEFATQTDGFWIT